MILHKLNELIGNYLIEDIEEEPNSWDKLHNVQMNKNNLLINKFNCLKNNN